MINAYIITLKGNTLADRAARRLEASAPSNVTMVRFDAIEPAGVDKLMRMEGLNWTYPWKTQEWNIAAGMVLTPYPTTNPKARVACFLSHYTLWKQCADGETMIIHEHDAIYKSETLPLDQFEKSKYDIIGLNDPRGATRMASAYDRVVQEQNAEICRAPSIDEYNVPQGIAGNSAYYIEPSGAQKMLSLVKQYGCWPNDAIMNRQFIYTLGQTKEYHTYVQGTRSTTTL